MAGPEAGCSRPTGILRTGLIYSFYSSVFGDLRSDLFYAFYLLMAPGAAARAARFLCGHLFTWKPRNSPTATNLRAVVFYVCTWCSGLSWVGAISAAHQLPLGLYFSGGVRWSTTHASSQAFPWCCERRTAETVVHDKHKPQAGAAPDRPRRSATRPARTGRRSPLVGRRSAVGHRPRVSLVRSSGRGRGWLRRSLCVHVCMCVYVRPTSTVQSRDRAIIRHHTTRACAYHENLAASASCFISCRRRAAAKADGRAAQRSRWSDAQKRARGATCAADHLSGTFEPRTEGGGALKCGFKQVFVAVAVGRRTMAT